MLIMSRGYRFSLGLCQVLTAKTVALASLGRLVLLGLLEVRARLDSEDFPVSTEALVL